MRTGILIIIVWALVAAFAAHAAAEEEPDEYVVWVDQLNLRAEPSAEADIITVLGREDVVEESGEYVEYAGGFWWRHVQAGESEGWVADKYVLPSPVYGVFKKAEAQGQAGDKEGMLATLVGGCQQLQLDEEGFSVSPTGDKIFVELGWRWAMRNGYLGRSRRSDFNPVAYFINGVGLADYTVYEMYDSGLWYRGDRYYVYVGLKPEEEWKQLAPLRMLDTETGAEIELGECGIGYEKKYYEFAGAYIIWSSREVIPKGTAVHPRYGDLASKPVVMAFNTETKKKVRILEAAMETLNPESVGCYPCGGIYFFEVKLVPVGDVPPVIKESELYRERNGGVGHVWSEPQV